MAIAALAVLVVAIGFLATDRSTGDGAPGSTFNADADGSSAFRELLIRLDVPVDRLRVPVREQAPPPGSTLVVLDVPAFPDGEAEAILEFAAAGGRVVAAGAGTVSLSVGLERSGLRLDAPATVLFPHPALEGIDRVAVAGMPVWSSTGESVPLLGGDPGAVLSWSRVGAGELFLLTSATPFSNDNLDEDDNARLAVGLSGRAGPVLFAEYIHGFTRPDGLGAIPTNWRWALGLAGVAGVVWILAHARRLGPPEPQERRLAPPRSLYVDSLASLLQRTGGAGEAVAPVRRTIRARLARRGWDGPDLESRSRLADHLGVAESDLAAALGEDSGDEALLAVGRVLAATHPRATRRAEP